MVGTAAALVAFGGGVLVGGHPDSTGISDLPANVRGVLQDTSGNRVEGEVLRLLENGYYLKVDPAKLHRGSVDGMVAALHDPYSAYLDPTQYKELQRENSGVFVGVGISIAKRGRFTVITAVYPKSPAFRAGLHADDAILAVDGRTMVGVGNARVVKAIRGTEGSSVTLRLRTAAARVRTVTMTRARIAVPLVAHSLHHVGDIRVGQVRLFAFEHGAGAQVRTAVRELLHQGARAMVLDLRDNPGGLVDEALAVTGVFVASGSPVATIQGEHRSRQTLRTDATPATTVPVTVLVNRNSASSSEIVTGALHDDLHATVVGTRTFGKAVMQTTQQLANGGALKYTSARYVTPKGVDVSKGGLHPQVAAADRGSTPKVDEALNRALAVAAAATG